MLNGHGILKDTKKNLFYGDFKDNLRDGVGSYHYEKHPGTSWCGYWKAGFPDGEGVYTYSSGH